MGGAATSTQGGNGGPGIPYDITGSTVYYGGGGGGSCQLYGTQTPVISQGGTGGGGNGSWYKSNAGTSFSGNATSGRDNTGGGGGGGEFNASTAITPGGNGGSGLVIISIPYK